MKQTLLCLFCHLSILLPNGMAQASDQAKTKYDRWVLMTAKRDLNNLISNLTVVLPTISKADTSEPFSNNGAAVYKWFQDNNSDPVFTTTERVELVLLGLQKTIAAVDNNQVTRRDFRRILKRVFAFSDFSKNLKSPEGQLFKAGIINMYRDSDTFKTIWIERRNYFLDPNHVAGPKGSEVYYKINRALNRCSTVLSH